MPYGTCPCGEMIANRPAELPACGELFGQLLELETGIWTCIDCEAPYDLRPGAALRRGAMLMQTRVRINKLVLADEPGRPRARRSTYLSKR